MIKVLDCTFRDGGYYTNWNFDQSLAQDYLKLCARAGIDLIEIGFLFPQSHAVGPFGRVDSGLIDQISGPDSIDLGFMINAVDYAGELGTNDLIESISALRLPDKFCFVRIAVNASDCEKAITLSNVLKHFGFDVYINLMRIASLNEADIKRIGRDVNREEGISGLYFADSFGSMDPVIACQIYEWLGSEYAGQIGFHGHDNKGLALANTMALINAGISLVDSTICGMGRGAGNTKTEFLLGELEILKPDSKIEPEWVEHLSASEGFQQLVRRYKWGASLPYYKAANDGIHPSYVQALVESENFSMSEIITALDELDRSPSKRSFNRDHIDFAFGYLLKGNGVVTEELQQKLSGKQRILLLGGHEFFDLDHVNTEGYDLIAAVNNLDNKVVAELAELHFSLNPARIPDQAKCAASCIVVPSKETIPSLFRPDYEKFVNIMCYPAKLISNDIDTESDSNSISLMYPLSLEYALHVICLTCGSSVSIDLIGFNGYDGQGVMFEMNQLVLDELRKKFRVDLSFIDETSYA